MSLVHAHRLLPRFARWLVVATVCVSLGLQWAVLQGVAWTGMLISYSRDGSLIEAVTKTFDGAHPCPLCKAVASGQQKDQDQKQAQPLMKKFEAVLAGLVSVVPPHGTSVEFLTMTETGSRRAEPPPRTPPRVRAA